MAVIQGRSNDSAGVNDLAIDKRGRAQVFADNRSREQSINHTGARVWTIPFEDRDPTDADDYFLYLQNTGPNHIHVYEVTIESTVAGSLEVHRVTGAPINGTAVTVAANTVVNQHLGNQNFPDAVMEVGVNITGLTVAGVLRQEAIATTDLTHLIRFDAHIVIPQGEAVALLWDTGTGILSGAIHFFEEED